MKKKQVVSLNAHASISNEVLSGRYVLGDSERKVVLAMLFEVDSREELDYKVVYTMSIDKYAALIGRNRHQTIELLQEGLKNIADRNITIVDTTRKRVTKIINWVQFVELNLNDNEIRVMWTKDILPFISELKDRFTRLPVESITIANNYAYRLYELVAQERFKGIRGSLIIPVEEIRQRWGLVDMYPEYKHLNKDVLQLAANELNKTDFIRIYVESVEQRNIRNLRIYYWFLSPEDKKELAAGRVFGSVKEVVGKK